MIDIKRETVSVPTGDELGGMTIVRWFKAKAWSYELLDANGVELASAHCVHVPTGRFARTHLVNGKRQAYNARRTPLISTGLRDEVAPMGPVSEAQAVDFLEDFRWTVFYMIEKGCP